LLRANARAGRASQPAQSGAPGGVEIRRGPMSRALFGLKTLATYAKTYGRLIVPHEIAVDIIAKLPELCGTLKKRAAPAGYGSADAM
jgi:hypothetical protein